MTTTEAATQLVGALESARATGDLVQDSESGALFTFTVSSAEYEAAVGEEQTSLDEMDGTTSRSKTLYTSDACQFPRYVVQLVPR